MSFIRVSDILAQKINSIQSKLPIKMRGLPSEVVPFEKYLNSASTTESDSAPETVETVKATSTSKRTGIDKEGNDRSSDVKRAALSRANSTAYIPEDKEQLMALINTSIQNASQKFGIDANLIRAVIKQESSFNPQAMSHTGAQGLMQIMPGTADALGIADPWDISQNIDGGTKYLRDQLSSFNGDLKLALAAYNAGPNSVNRYGGVPPYAETQQYVSKVLQYYTMYSGSAR